jgi:hypothetical protein
MIGVTVLNWLIVVCVGARSSFCFVLAFIEAAAQ